MANKERGEVRVEVEGQFYTLRPSFDALCELEALVDKPIDEILGMVNQGRLAGVRALMWCLLHEHHGAEIVTLKDSSRWIERAGGVPVVQQWAETVMGLNAPEDAPPENPPVAQVDPADGTGEPSSSALVASV